MTTRATGSFDVKLAPLPAYPEDDPSFGRRSIDKEFRGELVGTSRGEMLSAMGSVRGSAGYVAMERVTGTLHGRAGSFALQHFGVMDRGTPALRVEIVPDTGTGALGGIAGTMVIRIEGGAHFYDLDYALPGDAA